MDGTEVLTFTATAAGGDLYLDYRDGALLSAELNGRRVATTLVDGHLRLPAKALVAGQNRLQLAFVSQSAAAGKAMTRYTDKDDGSEYLYTLFVPMDADMAFPCFDQPDLKARFTLSVTHPAGWTVVGNTAGIANSSTVTTFAETRPISTYLFAFAAGPFARIEPPTGDAPAMYVRKSQGARAKTEAPEVQAIAAHGISWLSSYFAQPFPFPKYDLVLIPGFPFGGMEHAGATFLNEDGVLFRSTPTQSDYFRRDILVLHETTHQWFGDLVTMRWFDDLWLKEGGVCAIHGVQSNGCAKAGNPTVEAFCRRHQAAGIWDRRNARDDADLSKHPESKRCEECLRCHCVSKGTSNFEAAGLLYREGCIPRRAADLSEAACIRERYLAGLDWSV